MRRSQKQSLEIGNIWKELIISLNPMMELLLSFLMSFGECMMSGCKQCTDLPHAPDQLSHSFFGTSSIMNDVIFVGLFFRRLQEPCKDSEGYCGERPCFQGNKSSVTWIPDLHFWSHIWISFYCLLYLSVPFFFRNLCDLKWPCHNILHHK